MKTFYFTATGNSLAVAKSIGGELISIPRVEGSAPEVFRDDAIGIVFPTYACSVPKIVRRFLSRVTFEAEYTFAIATYGNGKGAVTDEVRRLAEAGGYSFDYVNTVLMVDNYLPLFDVAAQKKKLPAKKTDRQTAAIAADIAARRRFAPKCSALERLFTRLCSLVDVEREDSARRFFSVDAGCALCGACAKVCPMNNVAVTDRVAFSDHCACCLACVHACPQKAIHCKFERSSERWRHPDVTLQEIISSNDRT